MNDSINELMAKLTGIGQSQLGDIGIPAFVLLMLVSLVSSLFISFLYLYFYHHRATGSQINRAFPLLGLSVTAILISIQFSLPLSLGLLGALSMVRFRNPVKEPEEIGFIMLVIAASIACATFNLAFLVILLGVAIIALLLLRFGPGLLKSPRKDGVLMLTLAEGEYLAKSVALGRFIGSCLRQSRLESVGKMGDQSVLTYSFMGLKDDTVPEIHQGLQKIADARDISVHFHRPGAL